VKLFASLITGRRGNSTAEKERARIDDRTIEDGVSE